MTVETEVIYPITGTSGLIINQQGMYGIKRVYDFDNISTLQKILTNPMDKHSLLQFGSAVCWCGICHNWQTQDLHDSLLTPKTLCVFQCTICKAVKFLLFDPSLPQPQGFRFYHVSYPPSNLYNKYNGGESVLIIPKTELKYIPESVAVFLFEELKFNQGPVVIFESK